MDTFHWIVRKIRRVSKRRVPRKTPGRAHYLKHKENARVIVHARLEHFNQHYQFQFNKVFIKNVKTRWGSCSSNRNLNFSYKIVFLPPYLQDYLIVHELCHLQEMNHGAGFWKLVSETISDWERCNQELKRFRVGTAGAA